RALDNDLTKLVESNPGFLIAWCTWHNDMVCKAMERFADKVANEIISSRNDIKSRLLDAKRDNVIIAFLLLAQYENDRDYISPSAIYNKIVGQSVHANSIDKEKSWVEVLDLIKSDTEATTWFHPFTGFKRTDTKGKERGDIIPAVAIHSDKMKCLHSVTFKEMELYLGTYGKRAHNKNVCWPDWKKADKSNKSRACKFPWSEIPFDIATEIAEVCGVADIPEAPASEVQSASLVTELYSKVKEFYQEYGIRRYQTSQTDV
uniref:Uncharacterized protein n=1 Tax=Clytia hemisphaerica TaxID=252671 RepID=A0A7M5XJD8_9CNID